MIEKAPTSKEKENVDNKKSELNSLKAEIADADLASNKKSELTQKVDEFLNKLEKTTDLASLSNSMNELINTIKNEILNSEIEKIKDKKLNILNFDEAKLFAYSIFGTGPGTDLIIKLSEEKSYMITRIISLAMLEGQLKFGRKNPGPVVENGKIVMKGEDWTSFQLHTNSPAETKKKFEESLIKGKELCKENNIEVGELNYAQSDLISWLGYNIIRKKSNIEKLTQELDDSELKKLIGTDIQGGNNKDDKVKGVKGIGTKILENLDKSVSFYTNTVTNNTKNNYEKYESALVTDKSTINYDNKSEKNSEEKDGNSEKKNEGFFSKIKEFFGNLKEKIGGGQGLFNGKIKSFFSKLFEKKE